MFMRNVAVKRKYYLSFIIILFAVYAAYYHQELYRAIFISREQKRKIHFQNIMHYLKAAEAAYYDNYKSYPVSFHSLYKDAHGTPWVDENILNRNSVIIYNVDNINKTIKVGISDNDKSTQVGEWVEMIWLISFDVK